jgi:hypothetical protein
MGKDNNTIKHNSSLDPAHLSECVLACLNEREQDVLKRRHALESSKKETLEAIGKNYSITRERVRQIEKASLQKVKRLVEYRDLLEDLVQEINSLVSKFGGFIEHEHLISELLDTIGTKTKKKFSDTDRNKLIFIVEHFMPEFFTFLTQGARNKKGLSKGDHAEKLDHVLKRIETFLEETAKPVPHKKIAEHLHENEDAISSYLHLSNNIDTNPFGEWGMNTWSEVKPKRMADRIYAVLEKYKKPLHYRDISAYIEKHYSKSTHPPTVHNELIADDRFVLVGRGIYALSDWGYSTGTVKHIVENIVRKHSPLSRDGVVQKVLKQRMVARSTILLALNTNPNIVKNGNDEYSIK